MAMTQILLQSGLWWLGSVVRSTDSPGLHPKTSQTVQPAQVLLAGQHGSLGLRHLFPKPSGNQVSFKAECRRD